MKIVTILGARPQFIKAGSVSREINKRAKEGVNITEIIIHTGQHYAQNMSDIFFDEMEIPKPNYSVGIGGKSHGSMTGQMIEEIEKILIKSIVAINSNSGNSSKYNGFLYLGLMISANDNKPYLLEYNCRLGDPETQNLMMYLSSNDVDFLDLIGFDNANYPDNFNLTFIDEKKYKGFCCTVVLAADGYPSNPKKDFYLDLSHIKETQNLKLFHAGTKISNGSIKVIGGRILSVNTCCDKKQDAIDLAYENIVKIKAYTDPNLENEEKSLIFFRSDIGS